MKRQNLLFTILLVVALVATGCGLIATPGQTPATPTSAQTEGAPASTATSAQAAVQAPPSAPVQVAAQAPAAASAQAAAQAPAAAGATDSTLAAWENAMQKIYADVNPSVVAIEVAQKVSATSQSFPFFGPQTPSNPSQQYQQALGSGFVWDKNGNIVTNNHVVEGADTISVVFYDGTTVSAKLVGTDPDSDLAVVKVDVPADQLRPVTVADSTKVKVGQLAIAIGNPFGEENTMTTGIISALGRSLPTSDSSTTQTASYTIPDVIQTDAPINPGNSGGVLLDANGHLIGVTAAIESSTNSSAGIGFAIPSAIVTRVVPSLIKTGTYVHTYLGVSGTTLTPDLAKAMNLNQSQRGALVGSVVTGGPADKAGLKGSTTTTTILGQQVQVGGDVIVAIDGKAVKAFDDLPAYLADSTTIGQVVTLTILRNGKEQALKLTLEARPTAATPTPQTSRGQGQGNTGQAYLGLVGVTLSPDLARAMGLPSSQTGVLIQQVSSGSPADDAGLLGSSKAVTVNGQNVMVGGDVITAASGVPITSMDDLNSLLAQAQPGQRVILTILRDGSRVLVRVTLGTRPSSGSPG